MNTRPRLKNVLTYPSSVMQKQRGTALFIALIALVSMTIAGIALVRSVDTSNLIAGNLAFRQAALHASDVGIERAFKDLETIPLEADSTLSAGMYYATIQNTDVKGVPIVIGNWSTVPFATINGDYHVKYVIDRLCSGPAPVTDIAGKCYAGDTTGVGTKKAGGIVFSGALAVYYRVTVRVEGPRNTTSMVQALVTR